MSPEIATQHTFPPAAWVTSLRFHIQLLRRFFITASPPLSPAQQAKVERRQLRDLARRSAIWLSILLAGAVVVDLKAVKEAQPAFLGWMAALIAATIIPYLFLLSKTRQVRADTDARMVRVWFATWSLWFSIVLMIWLFGNQTLWLMPQGYQPSAAEENKLILDRQLFVYLSIVGQLFTLLCLSSNRAVLLFVMAAGVLLPSSFIVQQLIHAPHSRLPQVNGYIFFTGQVVMYVIVGWFVSGGQKTNYHRQVLLEEQSAKAEAASAKAVSERKRANLFVEAVSHDLRNPLHAMSTALETLRLRARNQPALAPLIEDVREQNRELGKLIESCFDLSRLNSGTWDIKVREVVLSNIIDRVIREADALASRAGLAFECQECPPFIVRTDSDAMVRILKNLVGNAIKYTPPQKVDDRGRVSIEFAVAPDEKSVCISVVDTGRGIPADKLEEIFKEYVQLENPERDSTKGFGLGLSIVRGLSRLLGDNPRVESKEGVGSRFVITVPIASRVPDEWLAISDQQSTEDNDLTGMTIILVEDYVAGKKNMVEHFVELGAIVVAGESAEEVLAKWREEERPNGVPHFIVCDYRLPKETGIEAIAKIRKEMQSQIPAAIVTAETTPEKLQLIAEQGLDVIPKTTEPNVVPILIAKHRPKAA